MVSVAQMEIREWKAGVVRPPTASFTGTLNRIKTLPVVNHKVVIDDKLKSNKVEDNDKFGPSSGVYSRGMEKFLLEKIARGPKATVRCIYNYEDRYKFSRILTDSDLIFDAHFESGNLIRAKRVSFGDVR